MELGEAVRKSTLNTQEEKTMNARERGIELRGKMRVDRIGDRIEEIAVVQVEQQTVRHKILQQPYTTK